MTRISAEPRQIREAADAMRSSADAFRDVGGRIQVIVQPHDLPPTLRAHAAAKEGDVVASTRRLATDAYAQSAQLARISAAFDDIDLRGGITARVGSGSWLNGLLIGALGSVGLGLMSGRPVVPGLAGLLKQTAIRYDVLKRQGSIKLWSSSTGIEWVKGGSSRRTFNTSIGDIPTRAGARIYSRSGASTSGEFGKDGLKAKGELAVASKGEVSVGAGYGSQRIDLTVDAGVEAKAKAGLALGLSGIAASGEAGAFVGAKARAEHQAKVSGVTTRSHVGVSAGLGAEAKGTADVSLQRIRIEGKAGVAVGLGGELGVSVDVEPLKVVDDASKVVEKSGKWLVERFPF